VNDRGPFHDGRVIDLSYTAALKLDLLRGVAPVEIERITNEEIRTGAWRRGGETVLAAAPAEAPPQAVVPPAPPPPAALVVTELPPLVPLAAPIAAPLTEVAARPGDTGSAAGFWVQLGAFREREGAENLRARASRGLPTLAPLLRVFTDADTHRLQAGPFATREAASATVAQVRDELRMASIVVERR
jgi:rare lipoprotein A